MAVAALVVGIVALLVSLVPFVGYVAIPVGLVAIGLGIAGISRAGSQGGVGKGMAIGGLVTGILSLVVCVAWTIFFVALGSTVDDLDDSACRTELRTLRTAVVAYTAQNGFPPRTERALVDEGFLTFESTEYDIILNDGRVLYRLAPLSTCPPP